MNPDLMRKIDYWVGIPLCFFISIWYQVLRLLGLKDPQFQHDPQNALFIELVEMGSTVIAYPALRAFQSKFPSAKSYFLCFKNLQGSVAFPGIIPKENIITIDSSSFLTLTRDIVRFVWIARKFQIDTTINFQMFVRFSTILSYISGARKRVGYYRFTQEGIYAGEFLTHKVAYNPHVHTVYAFLSLVKALTLKGQETQIPLAKFPIVPDDEEVSLPKIEPNESGRKQIMDLLQRENPHVMLEKGKKLVIVNPNASKLFGMRKWPLERYADLVKLLLKRDDIFVVVTGLSVPRVISPHASMATLAMWDGPWLVVPH